VEWKRRGRLRMWVVVGENNLARNFKALGKCPASLSTATEAHCRIGTAVGSEGLP
jgi:hypothetical protein